MTLLGNIYFNLTPPSSFEDIYRINRDTILSCRKFFSQGVDTDNEIVYGRIITGSNPVREELRN